MDSDGCTSRQMFGLWDDPSDQVSFAEEKKHYTKAFEWVVLELSRHMTILDIARHLGVSWDVVKGIQKRYLTRHYSHPRLKDLKQIATLSAYNDWTHRER